MKLAEVSFSLFENEKERDRVSNLQGAAAPSLAQPGHSVLLVVAQTTRPVQKNQLREDLQDSGSD